MLYIAKLKFSFEKRCFTEQNVAFSRHKGGEASRTHSPAEAPLQGRGVSEPRTATSTELVKRQALNI